jgi:hypothetical protein
MSSKARTTGGKGELVEERRNPRGILLIIYAGSLVIKSVAKGMVGWSEKAKPMLCVVIEEA